LREDHFQALDRDVVQPGSVGGAGIPEGDLGTDMPVPQAAAISPPGRQTMK
jgi:hypothetical protein